MDIAIKENGVAEIKGSTHNKRILEYHAATSLHATKDEVAWCAAFVSWCFEQAKIRSMRSARAYDYLKWGVKLEKPQYGAVVVFTHNASHVAYFVREEGDKIYILGGNQSDKVCYQWWPKSKVGEYRWPSGF